MYNTRYVYRTSRSSGEKCTASKSSASGKCWSLLSSRRGKVDNGVIEKLSSDANQMNNLPQRNRCDALGVYTGRNSDDSEAKRETRCDNGKRALERREKIEQQGY